MESTSQIINNDFIYNATPKPSSNFENLAAWRPLCCDTPACAALWHKTICKLNEDTRNASTLRTATICDLYREWNKKWRRKFNKGFQANSHCLAIFKQCPKHHRCMSRQFVRLFCPNLPEKLSCRKLSPYKFSVAVGTLYFPLPSCHNLENRKFDTWNLVLNNQWCAPVIFVKSELSQNYKPFGSESSQSQTFFRVESETSHDLDETSQSQITRTV